MNDDIAISVMNVTKSYKLYDNHADRVKETFHPFRKKYHHNFDAVNNVSFEVKKGETLGMIGRNGSGKSTLLQIVCGILQPTSGTVTVNGRVSALLELGTGFNPEFSGYHNVYINGSILGLTHDEIDARFDDIVSFADIGEFIYQPVKSYSSGMVVRLAFAVAISIEPDILVVDEALSVGDEAFQRKCFARINKIQDKGGTILFVSHAAGAVIELCNRALLFEQGELLIGGSPKKVVAHYHKMIYAPPERINKLKKEWRQYPDRFNLSRDDDEAEEEIEQSRKAGNKKVNNQKKDIVKQESFFVPEMKPQSTVYYEKRGTVIENPHITTLDGRQVNMLVKGEEYIYMYEVYFEQPTCQVRFGMLIKTVSGIDICGHVSAPPGQGIEYIEKGARWRVAFRLRCFLNQGTYFLNAGVLGLVGESQVFLDRNIDIVMFRVQENEDRTSTAIVDFVEQVDVSII